MGGEARQCAGCSRAGDPVQSVHRAGGESPMSAHTLMVHLSPRPNESEIRMCFVSQLSSAELVAQS